MLRPVPPLRKRLAFGLALGLLAWWTSFPCLLAHCLADGGSGSGGTAVCGLGLEHLDRGLSEEEKSICRCCRRAAPTPDPVSTPAPTGDGEPCRCPCTVFGGCKRDLPPALVAVRLPPAAAALDLIAPPAAPSLLPVLCDASAPLVPRHACDPPIIGPLAGLSLRL
jgi:hypothetical protein